MAGGRFPNMLEGFIMWYDMKRRRGVVEEITTGLRYRFDARRHRTVRITPRGKPAFGGKSTVACVRPFRRNDPAIFELRRSPRGTRRVHKIASLLDWIDMEAIAESLPGSRAV